MADGGNGVLAGGMAAVLFAVYLDAGYNIMSATNSSPQTTELFAGDRADTLWKYVKMGDLQIAGASILGAFLAPAGLRFFPLLGGGLAIGVMHLMYRHALSSGMENNVT
jgi:hypothetical protein